MIEIKTYSKPKKTGSSGGSSSSTKYISGVVSEAEHAGRADKAKRAEVADQANYAGTAASAQNAAYASEAGNLREDAEILQQYLSLKDTVDPQVVKGMVIFAKGLMSNLLAQLKGGASFGSDGSYSFDKDGNLVIESARSRDFDEMLQNGFALKRNPTSGKYTLSISDLIVWGRMVINTLEVRKKYAIGGNVYLSGASSKLQHVEKVYSEDGETVVGYKCYILKDDGTMATQNNWVVGDQALCQTFDIEEGVYQNVSNQYYWRLVTQVSEENVAITEKYIDKDGNEQIRELYEGQKFAWVVLSRDDCDTNSGIPASGDTIVLDGHRLTENEDTDYTERTNVLMLEATGSGSPRIIALTGVVDYKHTTDNEVFILSPRKVIFTTEHFEIRAVSGAPITFVHFMGPWVKGTEYHYYDQVSHANALWTCIVEKGKSTTDEPMDGSTYWRKEMSGGKGEKGDDAVSYNINFVTYKDDVHNDTLLYVYVVRSVGKESTSTLISNIPEISETAGLEVRVYCDGDYNENLTNHVKWSGSIQRSAWETVKNFEVRLYLNDKLVTSNSYSFGEQGESALEIIVTPETLVFDTDDSGLVPSGTSKQASISCYRNGVKVTNVSYIKSVEKNCSASVSESNSSATVTISEITSQEVVDTSGNSSTISNTSGYVTVQVWDKGTNLYHRVQVKFMVNVAKFTGQMVNTNKRFSLQHEELVNDVKDKVGSSELMRFKGEITQTAREISLSVSEKSVGRRNMLVGSAFQRDDNNVEISDGARIEINSGYQGTNCIKVIDKTKSGDLHYIGVYWDGSQGGRSIKIKKGKKYTLSCYYKTNRMFAKLSIEGIYTDKQENATRLGQVTYLTPNSFKVKKLNEWELFTTVIDTTDAQSDYIAFNFWEACNVSVGTISAWICRPMVEEGDTYNGWTLSEKDYDIIGANLIDNSRTLDAGGNVLEVKGRKALAGDAYELTYRGSDDYNTFYRIKGSTFKLGVDYTISFEVRGDAKYMGVYAYYPITNTKFTFYAEPQNVAMTEVTDGGKVNNYVTLIQVEELSKQQRVWSHFRFKDRLPEHIYFQFPKNAEQTGVTSWSVTITKPKIEVGAVVTEYTERKTDLVDKASLKAAGIEITSEKVKLYGDQIEVKPKKDGNDVYALFGSDGFINTNILNVQHVYAKNTNGAVYGHFGYLGAEGGTDSAGNQYPLWVGASNCGYAPFSVRSDGYMVTTSGRIGAWSLTERNLTTGAVVDSNYGTYMGTCLSANEMNTAYNANNCKFLVAMGKGAFYYDPFSPLKSGFYEDAKFRDNASGRSDRFHVNSNNEHTYLSNSFYSSMYIKKEIGENSSSSRVDVSQPALLVDSDGVGITSPGGNFFGGLAIGVLEARTTTNGQDASSSIREQLDDNRGAFVTINNASGKTTKFYLPKYPQEGQMLIVLQINSGEIQFYASNSKLMAFKNTLYRSGEYWTSTTQGQFSVFVYANGAWRIQLMNGR